ncbi:MAG: ABC transporter permease subunit [Clostridia bacterium]
MKKKTTVTKKVPLSTKLNDFLKSIIPLLKSLAFSLKKHWMLYLMLVPFILWYALFMYKPLYGLQIAFKDYNILRGIQASKWVGFEHFIDFLTDPSFWRAFRNTIMISIFDLAFAFPAPIFLAIMINEVRNAHFKKTIQTITYLPHFISVVVIAGLVTNFLAPSGIINNIIVAFGGNSQYFLIKPEYFWGIFTSMGIWKGVGFGAVVYIAALAGVDPGLYEAARIDGAGKLKQLWNITLPSILPTIMVMLILKIGQLLSVSYEAIILLYQPATYETADVISTYVYRYGLQGGNYDLATAVGLMNSVIAFVLVYISNKLSKKYSETGIF